LKREAFAAQFADDRDYVEVLHGVETAVACAVRLHYALLVPPLELAGGDAGEGDYIER
jgi:hypothetical protein